MDTVSYESFREQWLDDIRNLSEHETQLSFATKLFTQWKDIDVSSSDVVVINDDSCPAELAYREYVDGGEISEQHVFLVQSHYREGLERPTLIRERLELLVEALSGAEGGLAAFCPPHLDEFRTSDLSTLRAGIRVVLTVATDDPLTSADRESIDHARSSLQRKLGALFDIDVVTIESIYLNTLDDVSAQPEPRIQVPIRATLTHSGADLLVGAVTLPDFYAFLRGYRSQTEDLDQLFEKNVRLYLGGRRRVNKGMQATLIDHPSQFGLYNNGVTFVVKNFRPITSGVYELVDPYIVNGCQTTRTIWEVFNQVLDGLDVDDLSHSNGADWGRRVGEGVVVAKIVRVSSDSDGLLQNITRYTNSQNAVSEKDFVTLDEGFQRWKRIMEERYAVFLELQRGGWDSRQAYQRQRPEAFQFQNSANAFDLLKVYGAGWLREPGTAFGRNSAFVPGGILYRRILDSTTAEPFGVEDLYAAYSLQRVADEQGFGRGSKWPSRRQTRFLFYMIFVDLVRDIMIRHSLSITVKDITRAMLRMFRSSGQRAVDLLVESAVSIVDEYLTMGEDDSVFTEPAFQQRFNSDLNALLKWERLGKGDDTPQLANLTAIHKRTLGRGRPSPRDEILESLR